MTTIRDIVKGALKHVSVTAGDEEPSAEDMADGVTAFNDMVASWSTKDVHTGAPIVEEGDQFPFEDGHVAGVKAMLAVFIASDHGKSASLEVQTRAHEAWTAIKADFTVIEPLRADAGLQNMPSQRRWWA